MSQSRPIDSQSASGFENNIWPTVDTVFSALSGCLRGMGRDKENADKSGDGVTGSKSRSFYADVLCVRPLTSLVKQINIKYYHSDCGCNYNSAYCFFILSLKLQFVILYNKLIPSNQSLGTELIRGKIRWCNRMWYMRRKTGMMIEEKIECVTWNVRRANDEKAIRW